MIKIEMINRKKALEKNTLCSVVFVQETSRNSEKDELLGRSNILKL